MVMNDYAKNFNNSQQVGTILLDFSKAVDKVNHRDLLIKRGKLLDWMNDFLSERTQQVIINGESSSKGKVISIRLFADDSYLYKTIDTPQDTLQLQKYLDALTK